MASKGGRGIYYQLGQLVTSSVIPVSKLIKIPVPDNIQIVDISFSPDSFFAVTGQFQLIINGQNPSGYSSLTTAVDFPLSQVANPFILEPNNTIEIDYYTTDGTKTVTLNYLILGVYT